MMIMMTLKTFDPGGLILEAPVKGWVKNIKVKLLMEPQKCKSDEIVFLIHSHVSNFKLRSSQRASFGKSDKTKPVFVVFKDNNDSVNSMLEKEFSVYGDILLGEMFESYYHLVHKHVMGLRWLRKNCPENVAAKMDDDIYVNVPQLLKLMKRNIPTSRSEWIMGLLQLELPVIRSGLPRSTIIHPIKL